MLGVALSLGGYVYLRAHRKQQPPGATSKVPVTRESGIPYGDPILRSSTPPAETSSGIGSGPDPTIVVGDAQSTDVNTDYNRVFTSREVTQKARVLTKPEPGYTEAARRNQIVGVVVLKAVFSSTGTVTQITPLKELPFGLTEKAVAAAKGITFVPAMKDGHNVSTYIQLEYSFNLY